MFFSSRNMIQVESDKCKYTSKDHCGGEKCCECKEICPVSAFQESDLIKIDTSVCIECGACIVMCQQKAIKIN